MENQMFYATAKIRAKESKLLSSDVYIRLSQCKTKDEFLKLIAEYGYNSKNFNTSLSDALKETYSYVKEATKSNNILYPILLKYDLFNMTVYLKCEFSNAKPLYKDYGNFPINELTKSLREKNSILPAPLYEAFIYAKEIYNNTLDIASSQIYLETKGYEYILKLIKSGKNQFLKDYFMTEADIKNLIFALRIKKLDYPSLLKDVIIEGGNVEKEKILKAYPSQLFEVFEKSLSKESLDKASETLNIFEIQNILNENLKSVKDRTMLTPFGIEPIISYVLSKENEIEKLRSMYYKR